MKVSDPNNPLAYRYAGEEIREIFSTIRRYELWRKLWLELARAQKSLGISIPNKAISEMKKKLKTIDLNKAKRYEKVTNHEVVAHIRHYAEQCPSAGKIIHLGATSAYVMDNADLIQLRDGLLILKDRLIKVIPLLIKLSGRYKSLPATGYTHFQPAQITTIGKRFSLWLTDLSEDYRLLAFIIDTLPFLGSKGAVGTQASQLAIFKGNKTKLKHLDQKIARAFGFKRIIYSSGQTYSRQIDSRVSYLLSSIAQSASKFSHDLRLLQHTGEVKEPFGKGQVGSSAMPYKQNPILSERISSLARYTISLSQFFHQTHATQWLERSLDDSAGRRVAIPQVFMAVDAILSLYTRILKGIRVEKETINRRLALQMSQAASEYIMSLMTSKGENRQELHEKLRKHFMNGKSDTNLINELKKKYPKAFEARQHIGNSANQVEETIKEAKKLIRGHLPNSN